MKSIEFKNVSKRYEDVSVIEDLNMTIEQGEFVVLVGPSGCGKSTTLRMIAGLESITDGDLMIGDVRANDLAPKDRDLAMVFQSYALYPHMTVRENIGFGLKIRKMPQAEIDKKVEEVAEPLGLSQLLERKPKALSGGQRQRVALGRAIVRNPSVFLFDEPLSNLDAELRVQMRAEISKLHRQLKTTSIYVTHDQIEAMTMGDKIAVLNKGHIMQFGSPMELYNFPKNTFVAGFIGTPPMNLMKVKVSDHGKTLTHASFQIKTPSRWREATEKFDGGEVILGIRPEKIGLLHEHDDWDVPAHIFGKLEMVETLGHEAIVHLICDGNKPGSGDKILAKIKPKNSPTMGLLGEHYEVTFDTRAIHLFDPNTEHRLPESRFDSQTSQEQESPTAKQNYVLSLESQGN
ncbi:ABC transporter ATP-binding protein [Algicola sagamiensis]|uniref:ABC transporter ATP-binding protein n=1 Tax=Algicola sagamiensis TaxID=163869 RepID=UPI00036D18A8|nr:sn-glycerol-3-phosphate ABC transporter ATP-binding protein UgpC [Algicola sagamiensis]